MTLMVDWIQCGIDCMVVFDIAIHLTSIGKKLLINTKLLVYSRTWFTLTTLKAFQIILRTMSHKNW